MRRTLTGNECIALLVVAGFVAQPVSAGAFPAERKALPTSVCFEEQAIPPTARAFTRPAMEETFKLHPDLGNRISDDVYLIHPAFFWLVRLATASVEEDKRSWKKIFREWKTGHRRLMAVVMSGDQPDLAERGVENILNERGAGGRSMQNET